MVLALLLLASTAVSAQTFDLIIANGRIVDGSGNPWYRADIGIRGDRITAIGDLAKAQARKRLDAGGRVVAPGFIDMMGASSLPLLLKPASAESKLTQGITTMMAGEGGSEAPQNDRTFPDDAKTAGHKWRTLGDYTRLLEKAGIGLNVVHNVGAAQIRKVVIGDVDREPTTAELAQMQSLAREAMRDGAVGFSTALIYPPGTYAKTPELVALAKAVSEFGGFYSTHMRNESHAVLDAIRESITIGEQGGIPVHIYHLKAAGADNWPQMQKAVDLIADARRRGLDVSADIYPYIRNGIGLGSFLHPRHYAKGADAFIPTLSDAKVRAELRREVENTSDWENWYRHVGRNWDNVLVAQAKEKSYEGKSIAQIAKMRGTDDWTAFFDLVQQGQTSVNPKSMDEAQKHLALRTPFVSFCTDAPPTDRATATGTHPRAFGSFTRVLAYYVREQQVIPLEEAIRKMTSLPANRLRLYDRGRIAPGMAADLVVFDPAAVQDQASFEKPVALSTGMDTVIVNGGVAVENGKATGAKVGKVLRH
jgi:N-acyl-D-aspartate/D-glutamate deacylase